MTFLSPEERIEVVAILENKEHDFEVDLCRKKVISHSAGPMYWLRSVTKTDNFQWLAQNLPPKAPFPYRPHDVKSYDVENCLRFIDSLKCDHDLSLADPPDYMDVVMAVILTQDEVGVPKTREMMTSWLAVGYITWMIQFIDNVEWISQSEKQDKAAGLIQYANSLYTNQPDWMRARFPLKRGTEGTMLEIEFAHNSKFTALPQGERQMASAHPYGYFMDEAAHLAAAQATHDIAKPACRQVIMVSSPAPGWFGEVCDPSIEMK